MVDGKTANYATAKKWACTWITRTAARAIHLAALGERTQHQMCRSIRRKRDTGVGELEHAAAAIEKATTGGAQLSGAMTAGWRGLRKVEDGVLPSRIHEIRFGAVPLTL